MSQKNDVKFDIWVEGALEELADQLDAESSREKTLGSIHVKVRASLARTEGAFLAVPVWASWLKTSAWRMADRNRAVALAQSALLKLSTAARIGDSNSGAEIRAALREIGCLNSKVQQLTTEAEELRAELKKIKADPTTGLSLVPLLGHNNGKGKGKLNIGIDGQRQVPPAYAGYQQDQGVELPSVRYNAERQ